MCICKEFEKKTFSPSTHLLAEMLASFFLPLAPLWNIAFFPFLKKFNDAQHAQKMQATDNMQCKLAHTCRGVHSGIATTLWEKRGKNTRVLENTSDVQSCQCHTAAAAPAMHISMNNRTHGVLATQRIKARVSDCIVL